VTLTWLSSSAGEALSLPTSEAAQYLAVGVIALLGMAGVCVLCCRRDRREWCGWSMLAEAQLNEVVELCLGCT
jgi:hypothetical protein